MNRRSSIRFVGFEMSSHESGGAIQVGAHLAVRYRNQDYKIVPALSIAHDGKTAQAVPLPVVADGRSESVTLNGLDADTKMIELTFSGATAAVAQGVAAEQVILEVSRNPLINLVWLGTALFTVGFALALLRRSRNGTVV
ncbi:MAG: hypothetical protein ACE5H0_06255 [Bacteroidota bacterium]